MKFLSEDRIPENLQISHSNARKNNVVEERHIAKEFYQTRTQPCGLVTCGRAYF
jgi:hypothetical protein